MPSRGLNPEAENTDLALLRRVSGGDETALATLYDRYAPLVYSVVLRVLGDAQAAEEILQDIFYQLWRTSSSFDPARGTLSGWLLVCARNRAISRRRGRSLITTEELEGQTAAVAVDLESEMAQAEQMSRVKRALENLPPPQRQALELAYFEGLTHSEIAQRTSEPLGTVKTRLRAAVESLKRALNL